MKKFIPLLLLVVLGLFSCNTSTTNALYEDLMMPEAEGFFRGINFDMTKSEVKDIETARKTVSIFEDEAENEFIITTDMGPETLNFADITYNFDTEGLYAISVESYAISLEAATEVFDMVVEDYTAKYGAPTIAEDGFTEFKGKENGKEFNIAIKNIDDLEDSFGMYLYFDIAE